MTSFVQTGKYNGISSNGFGMFNVDGQNSGGDATSINKVALKFELRTRITQQPVLMPYLKFSLFDFDHTTTGDGGEVSRAPWRCQ